MALLGQSVNFGNIISKILETLLIGNMRSFQLIGKNVLCCGTLKKILTPVGGAA